MELSNMDSWAIPKKFPKARYTHPGLRYLSYVTVFFSQIPHVLDTSTTDVIIDVDESSFPHIVNIFPNGRWRMIALQRTLFRISLALALPLLPAYIILFTAIRRWITRPYGLTSEQPHAHPDAPRTLNIPVSMDAPQHLGLGSLLLWSAWGCAADADTFEKMYVQAWTEHYVTHKQFKAAMVSIFVDGEAVRVPIPYVGDSSDRKTCEILLMWYSWLRVKKGFGEILLPKRLVRVNKVKLQGSDLSLGDRVATLEFGRNGESSVEFLRSSAKIPDGDTTLTEAIADRSRFEGLEFIRAWDTFTISIITLLPLVLSLVFIGIWMGIFIDHEHQDTQVVTQTAFTVASYIITAGALVIALFAFLDSSSQHGSDAARVTPAPRDGGRGSRASSIAHRDIDPPLSRVRMPSPRPRSGSRRTRSRTASEEDLYNLIWGAQNTRGKELPSRTVELDGGDSRVPSPIAPSAVTAPAATHNHHDHARRYFNV